MVCLFSNREGLRLGRGDGVEWSEVNAALGLSLLLMYTLAKKLDFTFVGFELVPLGSFSRIDRIEGKSSRFMAIGMERTRYELYAKGPLTGFRFGSSDLKGFLFWNRKFDLGLQAFLDCLLQLGEYIEAQDAKFHFPYRISIDCHSNIS